MRKTIITGPIISVGLTLAALAASAISCHAGTVSPETWYQFAFAGRGATVTGCDPADPAGPFCVSSSGTPTVFADAPEWTFSNATPLILIVVDAFDSGDEFAVFDLGVPLGATKTSGLASCGDDPVVCLATDGISSRKYQLSAGSHSLRFEVVASPSGDGSAYFVMTEAPEPGTLALLGMGVGLMALARGRWPADRLRN